MGKKNAVSRPHNVKSKGVDKFILKRAKHDGSPLRAKSDASTQPKDKTAVREPGASRTRKPEAVHPRIAREKRASRP